MGTGGGVTERGSGVGQRADGGRVSSMVPGRRVLSSSSGQYATYAWRGPATTLGSSLKRSLVLLYFERD